MRLKRKAANTQSVAEGPASGGEAQSIASGQKALINANASAAQDAAHAVGIMAVPSQGIFFNFFFIRSPKTTIARFYRLAAS